MNSFMHTALLSASLVTASAYAAEIPVYLGSSSDAGVSLTTIDTEKGTLSAIKPIVKCNSPTFLTRTANSNYWFATARMADDKGKMRLGAVSSFKMADDGSLKLLSTRSTGGRGACHVSLDRKGTVLLAANYGSGNVASFKVKADGSLSEIVSLIEHEGSSIHPKRQKGPHAHSIYASPDNKFVYSADLGCDKVFIYSLNEKSGKLHAMGNAATPSGGGPRHMTFSHDGSRLYVLNELTMSVTAYKRNKKNGSLTRGQTLPVLKKAQTEMTCSEIRISDDGRFLYTANRDLKGDTRDSLSVLSIDAKGKLALVQTSPANVWVPRHFDITKDGKWLVVAGQKSNTVALHKVDPKTGKITPTTSTIEAPAPMWIGFKE